MPLDLPAADDIVARRSSIVFVVMQMKFSESPGVSESDSGVRLHELLGGPDGRYPQINQARRGVLNIGPGIAGTEHESLGWRLIVDGWLVGVFPGVATLQTENYQGWDDFWGRFTEVLDAVGEVAQPGFVERVGLRFTDRLTDPEVDSPSGWQAYIAPALLGPIAVPGFGPVVSSSEAKVVLDAGEGVTCNLQYAATEATDGNGSDFFIDCDFYWEGGQRFDAGVVEGQVASFKEQADSVFAAATTATLIERITA